MRSSMRTAYMNDRRGFALESTLIVLLLMSTLAVIAFAGAVTNIRTTNIDYRNARVGYASEAGAEAVMAQIDVQLSDGVLTDAELAALTPPVIPGFTVDSFKATKVGGIVNETISQGPFAGMYALTQNINIRTSVSDLGNDRSTVVVSVKAQAIPIFQFAAFWEGDLEDYAGSTKHMWGRVHGNGNLYLNGSDLHFHDMVTTPGKVRRDPKNAHASPTGGTKIYNAAGSPVVLDFDSESVPDPAAFRAQSEAKFNSRLKTDAHGVPKLNLPLPTGTPPREVIRPREAGDTDEEKESKFAWQADLYVTVDLNSLVAKNVACGGAVNPALHPTITVVRYDGGPLPSLVDKCNIFSFAFEAFWDNYVDRWPDPLTVDLTTLRTWLTTGGGSTGPKPDVIYIEFKPRAGAPGSGTSGKAPNDNSYYPVLRLRNGALLYDRLTIGSEYPLYMWGNYNNSSPRKPAAVFGDALTVLSNTWSDASCAVANCAVPATSSATHQWYGLVTGTGEGYWGCWHHTCTPPAGGASIWMRMLEGWGGTLSYWRGSFVSLWAPVITCVSCPSGGSMSSPTRDWSFDPMFLKPDSLPPATPVVGNVIHTEFRPVY